jgi:hypothetical protein
MWCEPVALAASSDPDNLYMHEAMRQPDKKEFIKAMKKEVSAHKDNNHWELTKRINIPPQHKVLSSGWAMKRKRSILYCCCLVTWRSKLQTEVALSTTEAEYVALSQSLREVIPIMNLLQEAKDISIDVPHTTKPIIQCTVFEDNAGALELANVPKMRAQTKHINSKYHHFRSFVSRKIVSIIKCHTSDQLGDGFTKATTLPLFLKHRMTLMGW